MRKLIALLAALMALAVAVPQHADAHASLTNVVYNIYNHWCGGDSPWHSGTWWSCENRKQQLYVNGHYDAQGFDKITYCYAEDYIVLHWAQRCVRANIYLNGTLQSAVWWTNSSG